MQSLTFPSFRRTLGRTLAAVVICIPLAGVAHAAASLAGPSVVQVKNTAEFRGAGYVPGSVVTVSVKPPGLAAAYYSAMVAADGTLTHSVTAGPAGKYLVKVIDANGKVLAKTYMLAQK
jgi:hypothetical protein